MLAALVGFQLRFLFSAAAFWTPDYRAVWMLVLRLVWLASGFMIPVEYFPAPLRLLGEAGPLSALLAAPVRVATGRSAGAALLLQLAWVAVLWAIGRLVLTVASRRLVVHGG